MSAETGYGSTEWTNVEATNLTPGVAETFAVKPAGTQMVLDRIHVDGETTGTSFLVGVQNAAGTTTHHTFRVKNLNGLVSAKIEGFLLGKCGMKLSDGLRLEIELGSGGIDIYLTPHYRVFQEA